MIIHDKTMHDRPMSGSIQALVRVPRMEVDQKQLLHLLAIARCGSFGRAAERLRLSQPALSNSIAQLERRMGGGRVFDRGRHGAKLTELGSRLLRHAEMLEIAMARISTELDNHMQSVQGPLVIGVTPVAAAHLVPKAVGLLKAEAPNLAVSIVETVFSEAMEALLKGAIDVMVGPIGVYPKMNGIEEEALAIDPFAVIVRERHPLGNKRSISLRTLSDGQWVLPSEQSAYRRQLEALFVVAGLHWPTGCVTTNSMAAMKAMVLNSDCVAIMPTQVVAVERRAKLLRCIRLMESGGTRSLGLSWAKSRKLSPLAQRFMEIVRVASRQAAA